MRIGFSSCLRHILGCSSRKKVHPFNDDLDKKTLVRDPQLDVKPPTELVVLVLGSASAGKSTLCEVMRGNKSPQPKRTMGIKPVLVPHDESANIKFVDIGGSDQMEKIWYHQFHSSHAIIFVIDSSALEDEFQKAVTISKRNLGHRLLREKPVLVVCNKIDGPQNRKPQLVSIEMDLNHVGENKTKFIPVCIHPSSAGYNGEPDPLIASSIKWLVTTIFDNLHSINEQISQDSKVVEEERENLREKKERRLLSLGISKAFGLGEEISDVFDMADGEDFLAHEVGFENRQQLPSIGTQICDLVGYQRLALLVIGSKLNRGKSRNTIDWDAGLVIVKSVRDKLELPYWSNSLKRSRQTF